MAREVIPMDPLLTVLVIVAILAGVVFIVRR
jgi:hypothetical protein